MKTQKKIILVTMGDPNGVGPEIIVRLWDKLPVMAGYLPVVVGDPVILLQAQELAGTCKAPVLINALEEAPVASKHGIPVFDAGVPFRGKLKPGKVDRVAGAVSLAWVQAAVELVQVGEAAAIVTAPLCKEAVEKTCPGFQGHTEFIGEMCKDPEPVLALVHENWVVAHVSTHVSLKDAVERASKERIVKVATQLHDFLVRYRGHSQVRIGVAGINPHAGEGGLFGDQEIQQIKPAVQLLRRRGMDIQGPLPGDVVFPLHKAGKFDGVVAMYHDQGHVVTKTLLFQLDSSGKTSLKGVNITLGLNVLRTSVDHGTGFDIAWKGAAVSSDSLRDALVLAHRLHSSQTH